MEVDDVYKEVPPQRTYKQVEQQRPRHHPIYHHRRVVVSPIITSGSVTVVHSQQLMEQAHHPRYHRCSEPVVSYKQLEQ